MWGLSRRALKVVAGSAQECGAAFGEEGHEDCMAHVPCSSRNVFVPLSCSVCELRIRAML